MPVQDALADELLLQRPEGSGHLGATALERATIGGQVSLEAVLDLVEAVLALGLAGACTLGFQRDLAGPGRCPGMLGLVLLARHLGQLGLLDQAGLEQLFLQWIRLGHDPVSCWWTRRHDSGQRRRHFDAWTP